MSKIFDVTEYDIFYLSYDEPNAEENWADIKNKVPWAKRVHGVEGSDAAHKECANQSDTERFTTVDGDNIIDPRFCDQKLDFGDTDWSKSVISWCGKNDVNGLVYGNGGIKNWPVEGVLNMRTHESAETPQAQVDFCWDMNYIQMNDIFPYVYNNASPYQAYRAGFREGVKMSLDDGQRVDPDNFEAQIHDKNYQRLLTWCTVGADAPNGIWAVYGARLGCHMTNLTKWGTSGEWINVRDFTWHTKFWEEEIQPKFKGEDNDIKCDKTGYIWNKDKLWQEIIELGNPLRQKLGLQIADFDSDSSRFYKKTYTAPPRNGAHFLEKKADGTRKFKII